MARRVSREPSPNGRANLKCKYCAPFCPPRGAGIGRHGSATSGDLDFGLPGGGTPDLGCPRVPVRLRGPIFGGRRAPSSKTVRIRAQIAEETPREDLFDFGYRRVGASGP